MKDEIKEILDYLAFLEDIDIQKKVKQVVDYIATLQEENETLKAELNDLKPLKEAREQVIDYLNSKGE